MMNVQQIANLLNAKPDYLFQVSIPGTPFVGGRILVSQALADSPSLEDYLTRILTANRAKMAVIRQFSRNGSSIKQRCEHFFSLEPTLPVATEPLQQSNGPVATAQTNVATPQTKPFNGLNNEQKPAEKTMNIEDQIAFGVLKVEHRLVSQRKEDLEKEVKALQAKVEGLHSEKLELVKLSSVQKEKNEVEMERALLSADRENKSGLAGIMGEIKENPEMLRFLAGFLKPDHPMFKNENSEMGKIAGPQHADPNAQIILNEIPGTLMSLDGDTIAQVYVIFKRFMQKQDLIKPLFDEYMAAMQAEAKSSAA